MNIQSHLSRNSGIKPNGIFKVLNPFLISMFSLIALFVCVPHVAAEYCEVDGIKWKYEILEGGTNVKIVYGSEPADTSAGNISGSVTVPKILPLDDQNYTVTELEASFNDTVAYGNITSVTLPDSITTIGRQTFNNLSNLTTVTLEGNSLKTIGTSAFYGCKNLSSITLPDSVTTISDYAFYNCQNLTSITIPDNVESLGVYTFRGCSNLESAVIGKNVPELTGTFISCGKLESVTIPNSVTAIKSYAFYGCSSLTSITVPCNFDKNKFSPASTSYINIPATDLDDDPDNDTHTFTVQGTSASGTFTYTHNYENPTYAWNYDETENKWTCTARIACSGCNDEVVENGVVTGEVTTSPTCSAMGKTTYTATFTNTAFSAQTKEVEDIAVDPNAHNWETQWSSDDNVHWHKCTLCESITDESEHNWELDSIITETTDTTPGEIRYLCSVCGQEKIETVLPHSNADNTENVEELINPNALADAVKNVIDVAAEKLKDFVDKCSVENTDQSLNPDTGDNCHAPIIMIIAIFSLPKLFNFL